jgi:hypothetical protein
MSRKRRSVTKQSRSRGEQDASTPGKTDRAVAVRARLQARGLTAADVIAAVHWSRSPPARAPKLR